MTVYASQHVSTPNKLLVYLICYTMIYTYKWG